MKRMLLTRSAVVYSCTGLFFLLVFSLFLNGTPDTAGVLSTWTAKSESDSRPGTETSVIVEVTNKNAETQSSNDLDTPLPTSNQAPPLPLPPPYVKDTVTLNQQNPKEFELVSTKNKGKVVLLTGATGPGHFRQVDDFHNKVRSNRLEYAQRHGTRILHYD